MTGPPAPLGHCRGFAPSRGVSEGSWGQRQGQLLSQRCGRPVVITAVSARSRDKDRGVSLSRYAWED